MSNEEHNEIPEDKGLPRIEPPVGDAETYEFPAIVAPRKEKSDDIEAVHNDGELDGQFGRFQKLKQTPLEEVIQREAEEREAKIASQYEVMDVAPPVQIPDEFVPPPNFVMKPSDVDPPVIPGEEE